MKKLFGVLMFLTGIALNVYAQTSGQELLKQKTDQQIRQIINQSPALTGLAAVDLTSGEMFLYNADVTFPQASAIKIPVLMEVFKQAHAGEFDLSDMRTISSGEVVGGTGILKKMDTPVSLSIRNLCVLMIALSDNTATNSLIDLVSLSSVNETLQSLGLEHTRLQRKMMDTAASARGEENISTPAEAASILQILFEGKFINKTLSDSILSILKKTGREHSRLAAGISPTVPVAFKPGFLDGASTEWMIVFLPERPYAIAAMESYKADGQAEQVMEKASAILYRYFQRIGNATPYGSYVDPELMND